MKIKYSDWQLVSKKPEIDGWYRYRSDFFGHITYGKRLFKDGHWWGNPGVTGVYDMWRGRID